MIVVKRSHYSADVPRSARLFNTVLHSGGLKSSISTASVAFLLVTASLKPGFVVEVLLFRMIEVLPGMGLDMDELVGERVG